ncbi:MAG: glycosyltransferase family 4 protein [Burkholderiaceae bacterium]|nr:glycosyltransferase family 4 protein [Burkholderiaceae bacterium]
MRWLSTSWRRRNPHSWWVIDDFFPNLLTGFRVAEYNALLRHFPGLSIASTYGGFDEAHAAYAALYPELAPRVQRFSPESLAGCPLAYVNFLNNAVAFLPWLLAHRVPFVTTLYPGGGFGLYEAASDAKLAQLLAAPGLRELIVTQSVTRDYIRARAPEALPITEIFGVVVNPVYFQPEQARTWHGQGKPTLDIAFVAEKYMARGENKGFPAFVGGLAQALAGLARPQDLRVHVVGSFEPADWREVAPADAPDLSQWPGGVSFHGRLETSQLRALMHGIDLVVSPNVPGSLHSGNFDGFPTGCCVEAALCGTAFAATDPLGLSQGRFVDGEHYLRLEPGARAVAQVVLALAAQPSRIAAIGRAGRAMTRRLFDPALQIGGRIAVLESHLAGHPLAG